MKQAVHIGTDLFTTCGIQLPFTTMLLSTRSVDKITGFVSMGDVIKVGTQSSLAMLINSIVSVLHGTMLMSEADRGDFDTELSLVRTRKIISISNAIASASSVVYSSCTSRFDALDIGGIAVTCHRLFTDSLFIRKLKYEYLNNGLHDIYAERGSGPLGA